MHNIYFARHGETVWNVENKICGMTTVPSPRRAVSRPGSWAGRSGRAASVSTRSSTRP